MGSYLIAAAALMLVILAREGIALECVECNSVTEPKCDVSPKDFSKKCNDTATSCRKIEQEIYYEGDYHVRTIRQCAFESGPMKCIERTGTYRIKMFYCHCQGDNCNGAESLSISLFAAMLSFAVALLFKL